MASIPNHDWLKAQNSRLGWRWRVTFYEALFTIARWPAFRIIAKLKFYFWTALLFIRFFLYVIPKMFLVGGAPRSVRHIATFWYSSCLIDRLKMDLDFANWMVGRDSVRNGRRPTYFEKPRLRWFFGFDRLPKVAE